MRKVTVFDLDNTLIEGDCCALWAEYLYAINRVNDEFIDKEARFLEAYQQGTLDINEYTKAQFTSIDGLNKTELTAILDDFIESKIRPIIYQSGLELITELKNSKTPIAIISASPEFLVRSIAKLFDIDVAFGSGYQYKDGEHGKTLKSNQPFKEGKVECYKEWIKDFNSLPHESYFYSDSHTDLPLLEFVSNPVIIHPDSRLKYIAEERNWPIHYW